MPRRKQIEKDWHSRGFSCDLWQDPPGQTWEDYVHDVDELVMVIEGIVEFEIQGEVFQPALWQELFIPAHALHSVRNKDDGVSKWLYGYAQCK